MQRLMTQLEESFSKSLEELQSSSYKTGLLEGLRRYAWWRDGVQYVGTCGTTLKDALNRVEDMIE